MKGVGLGYFGDHAFAIAQALGPFVPKVFGVRAGLLYRAWLPDQQRFPSNEPDREPELAAAMISYVDARHRALRVKEDVSRRLIGRLPVWEAASTLLSQAFGPGWMIARHYRLSTQLSSACYGVRSPRLSMEAWHPRTGLPRRAIGNGSSRWISTSAPSPIGISRATIQSSMLPA